MPSRSRSAAGLSLIRSSGLSRSGTIPSGVGLPKPRHRRGRKSHIPREKSQTGNGYNHFQSRSPWTAPLKEGTTIHHLKVVRCALPGDSCGKRMIASTLAVASNHHRGRYTISAPLRSVQSKRPLDVLHPCAGCASYPSKHEAQKVNKIPLYLSA